MKGDVRLVETYLTLMSSKSYRLMADGERQVLQEFGDPTSATAELPFLWSLWRFDNEGRLVEDVDVERTDDQEPYRCVYRYDTSGRLVERQEYRDDGSRDSAVRYIYRQDGKKVAEERWSADDQWEQSRTEFDEYGNWVRNTWYARDGAVAREQKLTYEYSTAGNVFEQVFEQTFFPTEIPNQENLINPYVGFVVDPQFFAVPRRHRTVVVHGDDRARQEFRYWPDGTFREKKMFDQAGVLREATSSMGATDSSTTTYDEHGRVVEIRQVAPAGMFSSRVVNDLTRFDYDEHGNLRDMNTRGP
ncbi:MAG: hypothetical protein ACXVZX_02370, partial [Terriglobales bacterium]